jgi:hypothetical protein
LLTGVRHRSVQPQTQRRPIGTAIPHRPKKTTTGPSQNRPKVRFELYGERDGVRGASSKDRKPRKQAPGGQPGTRAPDVKIQPEDIRKLCDLIRARYALDIELWILRNALSCDRPLISQKCRRADAILRQIRQTVQAMDNEDFFGNKEEYEKFLQIKQRLEADGKRNWTKDPPWQDSSS